MEIEIQIKPTVKIQKCVEVLEGAVSRFLRIRDETITGWGEYEAEVESIVLIGLVIRQIESVCILAKTDLVLLPGALTLSRSIFETSIRILWLLSPDDPFEREARWLIHLKDDENYYERLVKRLSSMNGIDNVAQLVKSFNSQRLVSQKFRLEVESILPTGYSPLKKLPNFDEMLMELNQTSQYIRYIELSQFSHGTHIAGRLNRKNFGTEMKIGEFGEFSDWWFIFDTCFNSFILAGSRILEVLEGDVENFVDKNWLKLAIENIEKLKNIGNKPLMEH